MADFSIKEVAKLAGVSTATVSRAINTPDKLSESTFDKVQEAIAKTGYAPNRLAQSFRRGRTNLIMVVLPSVGDPFFTAVMRGIRRVAKDKAYSVVIEETQGNTMTADEIGAMLVSNQTDGVILLASLSPFGTEILSARSRRRIPIVVGCECISPELTVLPSVQINNVAAGSDATQHLIEHGHTHIAMISGQPSSLLTKDREMGYRQAMHKAQLPVMDGWVVDGELSISGARAATKQLLNHPNRPTAIFCANDEMAIGCLNTIKSAGLDVPQDISVIGFDDIRYAEVTDPPLTTIRQPAEHIGERAMIGLDRLIGATDTSDTAHEVLPHRLVERQSVSRR